MENRTEDRTSSCTLTHDEAIRLARSWEPEASSSPIKFRLATCVKCARKMGAMWHIWINDGELIKEIHLCSACGRDYDMNISEEYPRL